MEENYKDSRRRKFFKKEESRSIKNRKERFKGARFQQNEEYHKRKKKIKKVKIEEVELDEIDIEEPIEEREEVRGEVKVPGALQRGPLKIYVEEKIPPWYELPIGTGAILGDLVKFNVGEERAVENLEIVGHNETEEERRLAIQLLRTQSGEVTELDDGMKIYQYDLDNGTWQKIVGPKRDDRVDWELVTRINGLECVFHLHHPRANYGAMRIGARWKFPAPTVPPSIDKYIRGKFPHPSGWKEF